jgi:probable F420-dependent oxidoreductase
MRHGVVFPQYEIGDDPVVVRDFVQAVEDLGYDHLLVYDHVLGADRSTRPGWAGFYGLEEMFHEPFVLFGHLAAIARRLELVTGVIILPQRQTALVAKQAAEVDFLSGGRLRLGVGVGWNEVEYEVLGEDFHNRGRRLEEQVEVLRRLWTQPSVTFHGRWHELDAVGINPLPLQRPIPIWIGGSSEVVFRRIARVADGWFPHRPPPEGWPALVERVNGYIREAGRDPATVGMEPRVNMSGDPDKWVRRVEEWRDLGASHISVVTLHAGLASPTDHIDAIRRWKEAVGF